MVADLINPEFLSILGLDPATVIRAQGSTIIAFQNSTTGVADFGATVAPSVNATTQDTQFIYSRDVASNETRTMVVTCPVGTIIPGAPLGGAVAVANVVGANIAATVTYEGAPLVEGVDFVCGDVIEIRIVETGADAANLAVVLQVQVLAGR
jgi:hypothetical protein